MVVHDTWMFDISACEIDNLTRHHGIISITCFWWSLLFKIPLKILILQTCIWNRIHDLFLPFNTRPKVIGTHIYWTNDMLQTSLVRNFKGTKEQCSKRSNSMLSNDVRFLDFQGHFPGKPWIKGRQINKFEWNHKNVF